MKEKVKEFLKNDLVKIVFIIFVLQFILNIFITPNRYDDEFFIKRITEYSMGEFLDLRWNEWTSRMLIEFVLCSVLKISKYAWIIGQTVSMTILGYSILKIFVKDDANKKEMLGLGLALILIYPLDRMSSAGWGATTVNYIWPFAGAMFSLLALKKIWYKEKIKWYMYPLYMVGLIFGCNQEQVCALMCLVHVFFTILLIARDKLKVSKFWMLQNLIVIVSLIIIVICPGNSVRKISEIGSAYPDFESLTIFDKLALGVTSTCSELIANANPVFIIFTFVMAVIVCNLYKDNLIRAVSLIPIMSALAFGLFKDILTRVFPYFDMYRNIFTQNRPMVTAANYTELINFVPVIMSFVILGAIVLSLLLIFKKLKNSLATFIFIVGFGTRCAMAFSPTIFASTNRTFIFMEFAMLICTLLMMQDYMKKDDKNHRKVQNKLIAVTKIAAVLQYLNILFFIMITQLV